MGNGVWRGGVREESLRRWHLKRGNDPFKHLGEHSRQGNSSQCEGLGVGTSRNTRRPGAQGSWQELAGGPLCQETVSGDEIRETTEEPDPVRPGRPQRDFGFYFEQGGKLFKGFEK